VSHDSAGFNGNAGRLGLAYTGSKIGDQLSKPGVVLAWLLGALGAPAFTVGLLAPLREAGALLPQLAISQWIKRFAQRRCIWVAGAAGQGLAVALIGLAGFWWEGSVWGGWVILMLLIFSLCRGACSIVGKDILGRVVPEGQRGRVTGRASSVAGWVALGVGAGYALRRDAEPPVDWVLVMLLVAGGCWIVAATSMARVREKPVEVESADEIWEGITRSMKALREDPVFLRFCIARGLLASTVLSMPFYVVLAQRAMEQSSASLGVMLLASSLATAVSGVVWGRAADRSSRRTLAVAGFGAGAVGLTAAWIGSGSVNFLPAWAWHGGLFFLVGLAHTGIRQGRKTYLVDYASDDNRARLVAVSNTLMGLVLLASGVMGLLAGLMGERGVIAVFAILGIAGGVTAWRLPEAERP